MLLLRSQVRRRLRSIPRRKVYSTTFRLKARSDIGLDERSLHIDRTGILRSIGCVDKPMKLGCYCIIRDMCSAREACSATPSSPSSKSTSRDLSGHEEPYRSSVESAFRRWRRTSSSAILGEEAGEGGSRSSSWRKTSYAAGAGAATVMILVGAVAGLSFEEGSAARTRGLLLSTWSTLWDTLDEFAEGVGMVVSDGIRDAVEAWSATATLTRCVVSVLVTVGEEPTVGLSSWLKPGVATLVGDMAAQENRRKAVVEAGGGRVVDWLLKAVATVSDGNSLVTQGEASRALAHLLSDDTTCERVLSRPHALPCLFQFASALHAKQQSEGKDLIVDGTASTGRRMLVTVIMDLITSSCDVDDRTGLKPNLPGNADPGDIAIALQVVKDGGFLSDDQYRSSSASAGKAGNDKGGGGVHGIGIRVIGGTGIVGLQRVHFMSSLSDSFFPDGRHDLLFPIANLFRRRTNGLLDAHGGYVGHAFIDSGGREQEVIEIERTAVTEYRQNKYGLWDDLQSRHITVPLAAWALAMWARASNANRTKIAELDENGNALLGAVLAPEKTVKWHGAMAMRSLLSSKSYSLDTDVAVRWSSALLMVAEQAGLANDPSLAQSIMAALTGCVSRNKSAHALVLQEGLPVMRKIACELGASSHVQEVLAQVLDVLTAGEQLPSVDESKKWAAIILRWVCSSTTDTFTRSCGSRVLVRVVDNLGLGGIPVSQAWLAMLLMELVSDGRAASAVGSRMAEAKEREQLQNQVIQAAVVAAGHLAKLVAREGVYRPDISDSAVKVTESAAELPILDLLGLYGSDSLPKAVKRDALPKVTPIEAADAVRKAVKALTELTVEDPMWRQRLLEAGILHLLRRLLLYKDYEQWAASETSDGPESVSEHNTKDRPPKKGQEEMDIEISVCPHIRKHAARLLSALTLQPAASAVIAEDQAWVAWLEDCADGRVEFNNDMKTRSYASTCLLNISSAQMGMKSPRLQGSIHSQKTGVTVGSDFRDHFWPRYEDSIFIMNSGSGMSKAKHVDKHEDQNGHETRREMRVSEVDSLQTVQGTTTGLGDNGSGQTETLPIHDEPVMDVIFIHGLRGGPFKTWRRADSKTSTTTPLIEKIDVDAGKKGTCWPQEWLAHDLPRTRLLSVKYKTNLSEWSGATLPLQEVSSMLLDKLLAAGVGERPLVFITHSMGGLVVKQILLLAGADEKRAHLVNHTAGTVFYSCPHFGSKLADMPWRFGYLVRPAPSIGELRSGSPKLEELNRCLRQLHKEGRLDVLSFSETKVTPLVEGYGGLGLRMEVVPIESAYPGFGELVVLPGTDHVNSCKPLDRADPAYTKTLEFLKKLEVHALKAPQHN